MPTSTKKKSPVGRKPASATKVKEAPVITESSPVNPVEKKPMAKLDDTVLVNVQSNTHGELIYVNQRTGDKTNWRDFGDVQQLSMGDLRAMRGTQRKFFENNWIILLNVDDPDYDDVEASDIYKALNVTQYYKDLIEPDRFDEFFLLSDEEIRRRVGLMSNGAKLNLVVAANDAIAAGRLDSIRKVKLLEELLGCELLELK